MPRFDEVTKDHVLEAIRAIDRGERHPFGESTAYDLRFGEHAYSPKAILALAYKRATGTMLTPSDFFGGISGANKVLTRLGFDIVAKPRTVVPNAYVAGALYTRDQIREGLGLPRLRGGPWFTGYVRHHNSWYLFPNVGVAGRTGHDYANKWEGNRLRWFGKTDTRVEHPSIQAMIAPGANVHLFTRSGDRDPFEYHGRVVPHTVVGGSPVEIVWEVLESQVGTAFGLAEEVPEGSTFPEGATRVVMVNAYERNSAARDRCVSTQGVRCVGCRVRLEDVYGPRAAGFIHVHHLRPIAEVGEQYEVNPDTDLRPVCPNCHAIIHLRKPMLTIEELRAIIAEANSALE